MLVLPAPNMSLPLLLLFLLFRRLLLFVLMLLLMLLLVLLLVLLRRLCRPCPPPFVSLSSPPSPLFALSLQLLLCTLLLSLKLVLKTDKLDLTLRRSRLSKELSVSLSSSERNECKSPSVSMLLRFLGHDKLFIVEPRSWP